MKSLRDEIRLRRMNSYPKGTAMISPIHHISPETVRENNTRLMQLYAFYLNNCPRALDAETVEELARDCDIPLPLAMAHCIAALFEVDAAGEDRDFFEHWLVPSMEAQTPDAYRADPYFETVKIPETTRGKWKLKEEYLAPFEPFVCRDMQILPDGRMLPQLAFFTERYTFPAVLENGREWMTLLPNETVTTKPAIDAARGRVLTFGMGLGYFAFHAASKPEVTSVTVVDISEDVLALFRELVLPQIPNAHKIQLVCRDAFDFAEQDMAGNFDFVFADIWHDAGDGIEPYLRMKEWEARFPDIRFSYWLEDTLRCYIDPSHWAMPK